MRRVWLVLDVRIRSVCAFGCRLGAELLRIGWCMAASRFGLGAEGSRSGLRRSRALVQACRPGALASLPGDAVNVPDVLESLSLVIGSQARVIPVAVQAQPAAAALGGQLAGGIDEPPPDPPARCVGVDGQPVQVTALAVVRAPYLSIGPAQRERSQGPATLPSEVSQSFRHITRDVGELGAPRAAVPLPGAAGRPQQPQDKAQFIQRRRPHHQRPGRKLIHSTHYAAQNLAIPEVTPKRAMAGDGTKNWRPVEPERPPDRPAASWTGPAPEPNNLRLSNSDPEATAASKYSAFGALFVGN